MCQSVLANQDRKISKTEYLPLRSSENEGRADVPSQLEHYGINAEKKGMDRKAFWSPKEGELDSARENLEKASRRRWHLT